MNQDLELATDCPATAIPAGDKVMLPGGAKVLITQTLGGNVTVRTDHGLFRIAKEDAHLIAGYTPVAAVSPSTRSGQTAFSEEAVWAALKTCFDPEIPVNIVDLGLVYDLALEPTSAGGHTVEVKMTLTAQGCGMGGYIAQDARQKLLEIPEVEEADVEVVWDPPWSPQMISPEGRQLLGMD